LGDRAAHFPEGVFVVADDGQATWFVLTFAGEGVCYEGEFAFDRSLGTLQRLELIDSEILDLAVENAVIRHARGEQRVVLTVFGVRLLGGEAHGRQKQSRAH
jgi:hypothetical protein